MSKYMIYLEVWWPAKPSPPVRFRPPLPSSELLNTVTLRKL